MTHGDIETTAGNWSAVACLSVMTFLLIASEFMPVSLLTPIAHDLAISGGQAGQAIAVSGFFAVVTSLFGNMLLAKLDRRTAVLAYSVILIVSGFAVTFATTGPMFMLGRALIGVSIGGFWSLSTAIVARLVQSSDLPKALAMLQGGTALASVIAAPLGSYLGGLIGWRGAFFIVVPIGLAGLAWQFISLPRMPAGRSVTLGRMFALLRNRVVLLGMAATTLAFMGQFAPSTYFRPFLENVTGLDVSSLSLVLLGLGLAGLAGTSTVGFVLKGHVAPVLVGLPVVLTILATLLLLFGNSPIAVAVLFALWGFFAAPVPVAWGTWMTRVIPSDLEAGGGLQVALVQLAITASAFSGGALFDTVGWWSPFVLGIVLLIVSAIVAYATIRPRSRGPSRPREAANNLPCTRRELWDRAVRGSAKHSLDWATLSLIDHVYSDRTHPK